MGWMIDGENITITHMSGGGASWKWTAKNGRGLSDGGRADTRYGAYRMASKALKKMGRISQSKSITASVITYDTVSPIFTCSKGGDPMTDSEFQING